jgi:NADPH:quinone reductase-like Zn-dependent oxidoreductase
MGVRAVVRDFGLGSDVIALERCAPPRLARGAVRVKMTMRSINPSDLLAISGVYRSRTALPFVPGFEGAGIVEEMSPGVTGLSKGMRVVPIGGAGAWQTWREAEADHCLVVPSDLTDEQAATSYVNPMTAWVMLHEIVGASPGMRIAVNAAGSAIGRMILDLANGLGATTIAFVRSKETASQIAAKASKTVTYESDEQYAQAINEMASQPVDVMFDCIGGHDAVDVARIVRPCGRYIHYGLLSGIGIPSIFWKLRPDIRFSVFHLRNWISESPIERVHETFALAARHIVRRQIETRIRRKYRLEQVRDALIDAQNLSSAGRVLIAG